MRPGVRSLLHQHVLQRSLHHDLRERLLPHQLLLHDGQRSGDLLRGRRGIVTNHRVGRRYEHAGRHQGGAGVERLSRRQPLTTKAHRRDCQTPARKKIRAGFFVRNRHGFMARPAASSIVAA